MSNHETQPRSLFRANAVRRYASGRETLAVPISEQPRRFVLLWVLMAMLIIVAGVLLNVPVPIHAEGSTKTESRSVLSLLWGSAPEAVR